MKSNKIQILILMIISIFSNDVFSQQDTLSDNYFVVYEKQLNYFDSIAEADTLDLWNIDGYKQFDRWSSFFENRHSPAGSMGDYAIAIEDYFNSPPPLNPLVQPLDWEYIGHHGFYTDYVGHYDNSIGQGWINRIWVNPDTVDIVLAGSHDGGIWKTMDGGDNWAILTDDYPLIKGIKSIEVDPTNHNNIYIATATLDQYSTGLFYSNDGGATWQQDFVKLPTNNDFYPTGNRAKNPVKLIVNWSNKDIRYLVTLEYVLMTINGGINWSIILDMSNNDIYKSWVFMGFMDIEFDPADPSIVFASGIEVWKITNNGVSATDITNTIINNFDPDYTPERYVMASHPNHPDYIWFNIYSKKNVGSGKRYTAARFDKTNTVTFLGNTTSASGEFGNWKMQCEISPTNDDFIVLGGTENHLYENGVVKLISDNDNSIGYPDPKWLHSDVRDVEIIVDANGDEVLYVGHDGSVSIGTYSGTNGDYWDWAYIGNDGSDGIINGEIHGFDCSDTDEDIMYVGFQDMNCAIYNNDTWYHALGGDGRAGIIDKSDPSYIYGQQGSSSFMRTNDYGENWTGANNSNIGRNPPFCFKPGNYNKLYVGGERKLFLYNDIKNNFGNTNLLDIDEDTDPNYKYVGNLNVNKIAISESDPDIIYASTNRYFPGWAQNLVKKALFKTVDGGLTWTDLSDITIYNDLVLTNTLKRGPITGMANNPFDASEIWLCFGNLSLPENDYSIVLHSTDGGLTWDEMTQPPTDIPANDIQYHKKTGILFLATDLGIYFYDRPNDVWEYINYDLPPNIVNHIRFNNGLGKMRAATYGRGVWQTDIPCFYNNQPLYVTTSQTWGEVKHIQSDVVIEAGVVLTITNSVYMPEGAKIIVKRNAQLILDGGLITNACNGPWEGILVYGHSGQAQDYTYQGLVAVLNGGTIENAVCAVSTIKYSTPENPEDDLTPDYYYTGGIVRCDGAIFKNNQTAVKFWDYSFDESESFFRDCQFITGNQVLATIVPGNFLEINSISGIKIQASSFTDMRTMANPIHLTSGILAYNGHFEVFNSASQNCAFTGLYYGIKAYAHGPSKFISVKNSIFDDNFRGIYINGMSNAEVTDNNFNINSPYSSLNGGYGLYLDYSTAYKVEDNNFYHEGETATGLGLVVNQSGSDPNQIYRNYFLRLECGMDLQGENRAKDGIGLQLKCNEYSRTLMDKIVTWDDLFITGTAGIAKDQGSSSSNPEDMAGNLFYVPGPSNNDYDDILNEANHITYYYPLNNDDIRVKPVDYTHNTVEAVGVLFPFGDWTFEDGCPPSEEPGGGGGIGVIKGKMAVADNKADSTENILALLIDGGNTEAVQTNVDNSVPPETIQVYSDLMAKSPYLSDTVVSTAIEKEDVLPGAMLRDIMVANPNTAKSEKLMQKLDERWDPLPEYMKAQILAGRSIVSIREETESRLAAFKLEKEKHFNALARYYINDTVDPVGSMDSLKALYENENSLSAKYGLAFLSGERGNWSAGLGILNNIPVQFELTAKESNKQSQMLLYYNLLSGIAQEGKSIFEVDEAEKSTLTGIEAANAGSISAYSRNILLALGEIDYEEPIILPDMLKSSSAEAEYEDMLSKVAEAPSYVTVQPNPAKDYIILAYELEKEGGATVDIHNINANLEFTKNLTGKQDQLTIDTRGWKAGVYIVTLKINGKLAESVKFTVID